MVKKIWMYGRYILVIVPFAIIFWKAKPLDCFAHLKEQPWWLFAFVLVGGIIAQIVQVTRWWLLIRKQTGTISFVAAFRSHCSGVYYGSLFPSSFGQELIRAYLLSKVRDPSVVWASSWVAKLLSLLAWIALAACGAVSLKNRSIPALVGFNPGVIIAATAVGVTAVLLLSFSKKISRRLRPLFHCIVPKRFFEKLEQIRQSIYLFRHQIPGLFMVFALTGALQLFLIFSSAFVIKNIAGDYHFFACLFFLPVIELCIVALPLTPNGIGIRESLVAVFLLFIGLTSDHIGQYTAFGVLGQMFSIVFASFFSISFSPRKQMPAAGG
ncbi:MAG: flippase-like domain-containing protein [Chitinivibrionales bacterium]|nr:flippase-like domain-containing protein [Chitinivibrionales bacterium]